MSLLDDIEKELGEISPFPWKFVPEKDSTRALIILPPHYPGMNERRGCAPTNGSWENGEDGANAKFIAFAPERIKLLVDFARASMTLCQELGENGELDLSEDQYHTRAERNFIAARRALKMEET